MDLENVFQEFQSLPPALQQEAADFIGFLHEKHKPALNKPSRKKKKISKNEDAKFWNNLASKSLNQLYDEDEPDYSHVKLKEINPNYNPWK